METQKAKRVHIGEHKVQCRVTTSFNGWQELRDKYKAAKEPIPGEIMGVEHTVTIDYSGMTLDEVEVSNAKGDVIKFQGVIKKTLRTPEDFRAFLEGEGKNLTVRYKDVGGVSALQTPEQQKREDLRSAESLSDEDLMAILAERQEEKQLAEEVS